MLFRSKDGRKRLLKIAGIEFKARSKGVSFPENIKAAALRALAIDSERNLKNAAEALEFVKQGLKLKASGNFLQADFQRRAQRLEIKMRKSIV